MNHFSVQKNTFSVCEDMMNPNVFCPKPRRVGPLPDDPVRRIWCYSSHQVEPSESRAGADLLEIFLSKGGEENEGAFSPPFFCGSPPSRAANPVVLDERFGEDRPLIVTSSYGGGSPISPRKGCVCSTNKFGLAPAAVRIEGFDCLDRRRRSCGGFTAAVA